MITDYHPRCRSILTHVPYDYLLSSIILLILMINELISMAGPHGFVKIMHMYLRTADIWICWFARFAFVKPSRLHLQTLISTLLLEQRWISPETISVFFKSTICIFRQVISTFDGVCCFLHCSSIRSEFTHPTHFHSALPTEWWIGRVLDWFPDTGGKKKGGHLSHAGSVLVSPPFGLTPNLDQVGEVQNCDHPNGGNHWCNCCTMLFYICSVPAFIWNPQFSVHLLSGGECDTSTYSLSHPKPGQFHTFRATNNFLLLINYY